MGPSLVPRTVLACAIALILSSVYTCRPFAASAGVRSFSTSDESWVLGGGGVDSVCGGDDEMSGFGGGVASDSGIVNKSVTQLTRENTRTSVHRPGELHDDTKCVCDAV
jgi:hypothetical protein